MVTCEKSIDIDNSQIAGLYSQLAGVLAGFAFTAVAVIVTVRVDAKKHGRSFDNSLRALIAGFLGLVLTSLNYAAISGDKTQGARATLLEIVAGVGFAASGLLLIYAVLLMLIATRNTGRRVLAVSNSIEPTLRFTLVVVLPMIILTFLYVGARDQQMINLGSREQVGAMDILLAVLACGQLAAGYVAWRFAGRKVVEQDIRSQQIKRYSSFFLGMAFASSLATAMITSLVSPCGKVSLVVPGAILIFASLAMVYTSVHAAGAK